MYCLCSTCTVLSVFYLYYTVCVLPILYCLCTTCTVCVLPVLYCAVLSVYYLYCTVCVLFVLYCLCTTYFWLSFTILSAMFVLVKISQLHLLREAGGNCLFLCGHWSVRLVGLSCLHILNIESVSIFTLSIMWPNLSDGKTAK